MPIWFRSSGIPGKQRTRRLTPTKRSRPKESTRSLTAMTTSKYPAHVADNEANWIDCWIDESAGERASWMGESRNHEYRWYH